MAPGGGGAPDGALAEAIDAAFGSFAEFQAKLKETGVNQFGSGWSWLVHDGSGLAVVGSANQDNPISAGKTPLLGVDVWEHAYYLKYQNRRPDYLDAWWNVGELGEGRGAVRSGRLALKKGWAPRAEPAPPGGSRAGVSGVSPARSAGRRRATRPRRAAPAQRSRRCPQPA